MEKPSAILVGTKQLQSQYAEYGLPTVKGRGNFPCRLLSDGSTCDGAPCTYQQPCEYKAQKVEGVLYKGGCWYFDQKVDAAEGLVALHNYSYFLTETLSNYGWFAKQHAVLVLDEADTLEDQLRNVATLNMTWKAIQNWEGCPSYPRSESPAKWKEWAGEAQKFARKEMRSVPAGILVDTDLTRYRRAERLMRATVIIDKTWASLLVAKMDYGYKLTPVMVGVLARDRLFSWGRQVLLMSATIGDAGPFAHELGIKPNEAAIYRTSSSFPIENRPIVYLASAKMGRGDNEIGKAVEAVDTLMDQHPNEPGLVHTVSKARAEQVMRLSRNRGRMIVHGFADDPLEDYLEQARAGGNKVLVSPSIARGVDFPGGLARWQAILKLPYPDISDPVVKARLDMEGGWNWYMAKAAQSMVQMTGRIVRSEEDHGVTYILDAGFPRLLGRAKKSFPGWWTEAIRR